MFELCEESKLTGVEQNKVESKCDEPSDKPFTSTIVAGLLISALTVNETTRELSFIFRMNDFL